MQAVILAAGKGVRMLPLTMDTPKSLLKIGDKSILDYTLAELPDSIDEVVLVLGYLGQKIKTHVSENYPDKKFTFVEVEALGTGYAVSACRPYLNDEFIVLNGDDLYKKADIEKLLNVELGILVKDVSREPGFPDEYQRFGRVVADQSGNFAGLELSINQVENLVVIGGYKLNKNFFDYELVRIQSGEFGLPQTIFSMSPKHSIKIVKADFWVPIGFPNDLKKAEEILNI